MSDSIEQQRWLETYKSLITISLDGFKFLALANGGAATAALTYLGSASNKPPAVVAGLIYAIIAFVVGIVACGLALGCSYLTQLALFNELSVGGTKKVQRHHWVLRTALALYLLSLGAFGYGCITAAMRFQGG